MILKTRLLSFASIVSLTIAVSPALAAGSHEGGHGDGMDHKMMHPEIGEPGDPAAATETIEVVMNDNYFEPESITVPAGATVRFVVKNEGGLLHEFNIGTAAMHAEMQPEMAMMMEHGMLTETGMMHDMADMDHSQMNGMNMDEMMASLEGHPNRVLVEPGETKEFTWTFSQDTELEFACNLPGRYDSGMMGDLKVED
jgi:uncharacterized cupredoxin-like copper-binding protein